jgi:hypothetical protein
MWVVLEELNFLPNGTWIGKEVLLSISEIILVLTNGLIGNSASVQSIAVRILFGCIRMILPSWSCHSVLAESNKMRLAGLPRDDVSFKKALGLTFVGLIVFCYLVLLFYPYSNSGHVDNT